MKTPTHGICIRCAAIVLLSTIALTGCATTPNPPSENGGMIRERNEGYSLLYKLMSDESKVSDLLIFKHADFPVHDLIKDISNKCDYAKKQMDSFPDANSRIEFDVPDLPRLEQASRDLESKADAKELLGSSGKDFELWLVFTQAQAMGYASNLCQALLNEEQDIGRRKFLTDLLGECTEFEKRLLALLEIKS